MSSQQLWRRHSLPLLALAGICSALVTVGLASSSSYLTRYFLAPGLSFGLFIPLYFRLYARACSVWRFLAFLSASVAAFQASMCTAFVMRLLLPANLNDPVTVPSLFAGGVVGGFIVLMAASILFRRSERRPAVLRVLAASLAAGVLGVAGWNAGRVLGLPPTPVRDFWRLNGPGFFSLYGVWQTGTALLLGWLVIWEGAASTPDSPPFSVAPLHPPSSRTEITLAGLFFCAVLGFLGWFVVRNVQGEREEARRNQALKSVAESRDRVFKQYLAETPPVTGLPPIQKLDPDQALIVTDIGGFRPERTATVEACRQEPALNGEVPKPPCVTYNIVYTLQNQPVPPPTYPPRISVRLTQYPNAAWARHLGHGYTSPLDNPESVAVTGATRIDHIMRATWINGTGTQASYIWPSGNIVVRVAGSTSSLTDDFLRCYLAKYPSSL